MSPLKMLSGLLCLGVVGAGMADEPAPLLDPALQKSLSAVELPACHGGPNGTGLLGFYQRLAAKTEVKPFPVRPDPEIDTGYERTEPPLWENLGSVHWPITTAAPQAQRYFDQGLRLAYAFNHAEARRAFRAAQQRDANCAMCYWGEALVLGPHINAPMDAAAIAPAMSALQAAQRLANNAAARERALIEALSRRYSADAKIERATLDAAYAEAMAGVARQFADDSEVQVLYAEALMNLSPWDYWQAGGSEPKNRTAEILAVLERVLEKHPDHPAAIHYYIHMVEASDRPERAAPYAARLAALMPGAGHLVHMPFHIYFRVGRYAEAIAANKAAVAADEAFIREVGPQGMYPQAYYPHNVHSLMASAQMAGDGETSIMAAEKLARLLSSGPAADLPIVQPMRAAPYFAHAQFSPPATILALPEPQAAPPYVQAMWHYARGVAHAARGDDKAAGNEVDAIARIAKQADFSALKAAGIPAVELLDLARHVVLARAAQAQGDLGAARREFEQAVAIQDALAYMEPPYWYYPVRQSLGAVLLAQGDRTGAEEMFRASLARAPNNGWALYGLTEVYRRSGRPEDTNRTRQLFERAWLGDVKSLDLARL